ncbi:hypothetical protein ACTFIR_001548 [Dictyostelium discoideum]
MESSTEPNLPLKAESASIGISITDTCNTTNLTSNNSNNNNNNNNNNPNNINNNPNNNNNNNNNNPNNNKNNNLIIDNIIDYNNLTVSPLPLNRSRSNSMNSGPTVHVISSTTGRGRSSSMSNNSMVINQPCGGTITTTNINTNNNNNNSSSNSYYNYFSRKSKNNKKIKVPSSPESIGGMGIMGGGIEGGDKYSFVLTASPSPNTYFNNNSVNNNLANFSLTDEGYLDTIAHENLKDPATLIRQREISSEWTSKIIPTNCTTDQARKNLKALIRKGIPDKKRNLVWKAIIGTNEADQTHCYNSAYSSSFGDESDPNIRNIPAFGGLFSPSDHLITEQGVKQVKSILNLIHTNSHVEYCPQISDLVHILISFMSEANTYTTTSLILKDAEENRPHRFLNIDKKECAKFVHSFDHLIELHLPKLHRHMITIGLTNSFVFSDEWFSRLFVSFLPYNTVLRIFDILLNEGYKVLYRIGLALLKTHKKQLKKQKDIEKFLSTLNKLNLQMFDADALIKVAFESISLKRSHLEDINDKQNHKVKDVPEPAPIYYRSKITIPSVILNSDDFELIWAWLPPRLSVATPRRLFNSVTDGNNIRLLFESLVEHTCILVVLKSDNGSVFGFYSDSEVQPKFGFGDRNVFLFSLKPHVHVYKPTEKNQLYASFKEQSISIGHSNLGEIGLFIGADLNGKTGATETFGNPSLNDKDQHTFQTIVLEAFTIEQ